MKAFFNVVWNKTSSRRVHKEKKQTSQVVTVKSVMKP